MVCSESEQRQAESFTFRLVKKISSKGQIGSTCMGPLASAITFAKKNRGSFFRPCHIFSISLGPHRESLLSFRSLGKQEYKLSSMCIDYLIRDDIKYLKEWLCMSCLMTPATSTIFWYFKSRPLRTLHYKDLHSVARRLRAIFLGVIAFDFSINVVANTGFGNYETKNLSGPSFMF